MLENGGYECVNCNAADKIEKDMTIFRFPPVLLITLKRFENSSMSREKLSTRVTIPLSLDMAEFGPLSEH